MTNNGATHELVIVEPSDLEQLGAHGRAKHLNFRFQRSMLQRGKIVLAIEHDLDVKTPLPTI